MRLRLLVFVPLAVIVFATIYVLGIYRGWYGSLENRGDIQAVAPIAPQQQKMLTERQRTDAQRLGRPASKAILFGDLHVHTTFSSDAFRMSLPMVQGDGTHPPADACDFARVCANLDFWALTDHAESLPPKLWEESVKSVQQCDAIAGDPASPDLVTFLGYEWTQSGTTPDTHYGHKNVIFKGVRDEDLPSRPIASPVRGGTFASIPAKLRVLPPLRDFAERHRYYDFGRLITEIADTPLCDETTPSPDLPASCAEVAADPAALFRKLDEWALPALVIPHGTAWGVYSPPGTSLDKQLDGQMHDEDRQTLIEVYSGHGASEVYRDWRAVRYDSEGKAYCPEPTPDYLPSCWRAGEIIRKRCLQGDASTTECEDRAAETRLKYLSYGLPGWHAVPGTMLTDWLDSGQCRDCVLPAFNYRPAGSAQYGLAIGNFSESQEPRRFRFGFIASSDNHSARPGTGYKEYRRDPMTDWWGYKDAASRQLYSTDRGEPTDAPRDFDVTKIDLFNILELERQSSFFSTGGLVAVHAADRSRDSIWDSLQRKETYGTSGERILLWFDLTNPSNSEPGQAAPMGSEVQQRENPQFKVQALGSFRQKPGCPDSATAALSPERLDLLCRGECYHPAESRNPIERLEIIRILPQTVPGEPVGELIDDPWRVFECDDSGSGCTVEFEDESFAARGRDAVYYVRAIQAARATINAEGLRCEIGQDGECISVNPCYGDDRTDPNDNCDAPLPSYAWSSPIFVDHLDRNE